jgi:signal transduction histidine kinase
MVVRVGAAAAWAATAIYIMAAALSGDQTLLIESVGPMLAAALMTHQIVVGKEDGGVALFGSGLIVAVWYTLFGDVGTVVPASVALVLISSLAMLFVTRYRALVATTLALALFGVPFLWAIEIDEQMILGAVLTLSFVMTYFILGSIQDTSAALNARYQMLFEESPTAVIEEDWSEALDYVRSEYTGKPERIRQFLLAYPAVVRRAVSRAKIVRANEAAMKLLEIRNPARFLGYRDPGFVDDENMETFVSALVCLYEGGTAWEFEVPTRRRSGELQWLQNRSVDTSTGAPASSIVVALADVTHMKARNEAMAQMVRAKDEFIANISHELRTPLTAVIGLTSELAGTSMSPEEHEELMQLVAGQAAEMANIVDDLLVAARAEMGTVTIETQAVDLIEELKSTVEGLGISVEMPSERPPLVFADPRRVRQICNLPSPRSERWSEETDCHWIAHRSGLARGER